MHASHAALHTYLFPFASLVPIYATKASWIVELAENLQSIMSLLADDSCFFWSNHATSRRLGMCTERSNAFVVSPPMLNTCKEQKNVEQLTTPNCTKNLMAVALLQADYNISGALVHNP